MGVTHSRASSKVLKCESSNVLFARQGVAPMNLRASVSLCEIWIQYVPPPTTNVTTYPLLSCGTNTTSYIWGNDLSGTPQGAGGVGGLLAVIEDGEAYHPCYDANGNITEYVDTNGVVVAHYEYDAFGNLIPNSSFLTPNSPDFKHRFSTQYYDTETGLIYHKKRYYSPPLNRFISRDPIVERGGLNLYGFCGNDPINKWDYLGMMRNLEYKPVMAAIYLSTSGHALDTGSMMGLLSGMDANLKWDLNNGSIPAGKKKGKQSSNIYKEVCYKHVYFIEAELSNKEGATSPLGYGNGFSSVLWVNRIENFFFLKPQELNLNFDLDEQQIAAKKFLQQAGGYLLTHEILHAVGASHTGRFWVEFWNFLGESSGDADSVMTVKPTLDWAENPPSIYPITVQQVKKKLGVKP